MDFIYFTRENMTNALFDLHIWIKAKDLAKEIYSITKNKNFDQDR
jgi:hypothetical protein